MTFSVESTTLSSYNTVLTGSNHYERRNRL